MSFLVSFIISIVVIAVSLLIISKLPLGVEVDSPGKALAGGAAIGLINGFIGLIPGAVSGFFAILTLGLLPLLSGVIVFGLAAWLVEGFRLKWGIWSAILGAIALAIVNSILRAILGAVGL
ncbi:MAG: phage holin family protein [Cyanobacteria bacterium]|nr:phage holin family protein [Cyanobacteriota bacterium]